MILFDKKARAVKSFSRFLSEANAVGAKFEEKVAKSVQDWLKANGLSKKFEACRYQPLSEDNGRRDEDYSDVIVQEIAGDSRFFIECKEFDRSNVLNLRFDIGQDGRAVPVKGKDRTALSETETERVSSLTESIQGSDGFGRFVDFLNSRNRLLKGLKPSEFWFDEDAEDADRFLPALIRAYNKAVRGGKTEADCKEFDEKKLRDSTKNILLCALCWRLSDPKRTWDICKVDRIPGFGDMIRRHYADGKAETAKYIQFGPDKLFMASGDNPLGLKGVPVFPDEIDGEFSLKFTPRFGSGSIYVTPRSEITSELKSDFSFADKKKWPKT